MAFPWTFYENFDGGDRGLFNSANDSGTTLIDYPDYKELARSGMAPWQGAHCLRIIHNGTATSDIQEDDGLDIAAGATLHIWFPICVAADYTLAANDVEIILAIRETGTNEVVFGVDRSGDDYRFFAGETGATRTLVFNRSNSVWHQIELSMTIDNSGPDGTIDFYVDGTQVGGQIATLSQGAITTARYGAVSGTSATSAGTILLGTIIADDARVYPRERFPVDTTWVQADTVAFVGKCTLDSASVTGTSTDAVLTLLDTDVYTATGTNFSHEPVVYIRNITANDQAPGFNTPVKFKRGIYAQLTGTSPQAFISIKEPSSPVLSQGQYVTKGMRQQRSII